MLTDTQCRNAPRKEKPYKLKAEKGLYLEIKPNGVKAWRYRFELVREGARKESVFAIGDYAVAPAGETPEQAEMRRAGGLFTLTEARNEREKARGLVKQGLNPAHHRQLEKIKKEQAFATTFESVAREWVKLKDWEEITKNKRLQMLERVVFPAIGKLPIRQIIPAQILDVLTKASENNGLSVAAEAKRTMSGIFELAVSTLRADADPVYPVRKALPPNKTQHKRPLSSEEIGQLLRDLAGYESSFQVVAAFRLLWLTLCRPIESVAARWEDIDLETGIWRIPAERMKMRNEHVIALSRQAIEVLKAMQGFTGHRGYVFPHRDNRDSHMTTAALQRALHSMGWKGKYSPHATRTTGSTRLNEIGYAADWIERQLAHTGQNASRRSYNHATYLKERKDMMQQWADMLDTWQSGAKILPFNKDVVRLKESA